MKHVMTLIGQHIIVDKNYRINYLTIIPISYLASPKVKNIHRPTTLKLSDYHESFM